MATIVDAFSKLPSFYHDSYLMGELWEQYGIQYGEWVDLVNGIADLINPYKVPSQYINYLAATVGLAIFQDENTNAKLDRELLTQVVSLYKLKGTYNALVAIAGLNGLSVNIWDLYCPAGKTNYNDFSTYVQEPWFVGMFAGDNPSGLTSNYIKTPHFVFEILLNRVFGSGANTYLFSDVVALRVAQLLIDNTAINTVPHKRLLIQPVAPLSGVVDTEEGNIVTGVVGDWSTDRYYLDMTTPVAIQDVATDLVIDTASDSVVVDTPLWYLDSTPAVQLDFAGAGMLLTRWVLGTGTQDFNKLLVQDNMDHVDNTPANGVVPDVSYNGAAWVNTVGGWVYHAEGGVPSLIYPLTGGAAQALRIDLGHHGFDAKFNVVSDISANHTCSFIFRDNGTTFLNFVVSFGGTVPGGGSYNLSYWDGVSPTPNTLSWGAFTTALTDSTPIEITDNGVVITVIVRGVEVCTVKHTLSYGTKVGFNGAALCRTVVSALVINQIFSAADIITNPLAIPYSGTIDSIETFPDHVNYIFTVPSSALQQLGITQMGLYFGSDPNTLRVASTFPAIDKLDGYELKVITRINN